MLTSELDYDLPQELIAQHPVVPRDRSRLLVYHRRHDRIEHRILPDILDYLGPSDLLIYNDSRVLRARVFARKATGGRVELLFLRRHRDEVWQALVRPSARLSEGTGLELADTAGQGGRGKQFVLEEHIGEGMWLVRNVSGIRTEELLEQVGEMPLPPYIHEQLEEPERYQTIYAVEPGSAAAPTAGLHFTPELIGRIRDAGIGVAPLTLHIGLDTFRSVGVEELERHHMHRERYSMPPATFKVLKEADEQGKRIVAVGTTTVRVLETVCGVTPEFGDTTEVLEGETDLFITPGYKFRAVDAMLTNFHLPRSTLLAMVMAFVGVQQTRRLYSEAIRERYRFYSFGDAMLLL